MKYPTRREDTTSAEHRLLELMVYVIGSVPELNQDNNHNERNTDHIAVL